MKQLHVYISGQVQGVGFRQFVRSTARKANVTGWVRNTEDGGVEAVLQGKKEILEEVILLCRKGPFLSEVKQFGFEWEEVEEDYKEFTIR